jgi:hypothetical protein
MNISRLNQFFISKFIFLLFLVSINLFSVSCSETKSAFKDKPKVPLKPEDPNPTDESENQESPLQYAWYFKEDFSIENHKNLPLCPDDFALDETCTSPLTHCARGQGVYSCYPENLEIRVSGSVVDQNGVPLRGVQIFNVNSLASTKDEWVSESKKSGKYLVKFYGGCSSLLSASKDGYVSSENAKAYDLKLSMCESKDFKGSTNIQFTLKQIPRTTNLSEIPVSSHNMCKITGRVIDTLGNGIPDVIVINGHEKVLTDNFGNYLLFKDESCSRFCVVKKAGYRNPDNSLGSTAMASCYSAQPGDIVMEKTEEN